ncbi:MAG: hypothetical protein MAG451_00463 [Anaerolineales bacterium]|nr:hypothetical protein [Anaerolineales bacterium]
MLERLHEAGVVDARLHRIDVEEVGRIVRRLGVGRGQAQERPVRLSPAPEGRAGAVDGLTFNGLAVEELGDIVVLLPGLGRDGQVVPVLGLEVRLVLRVSEQVPAEIDHVGVAVIRQREDLAGPRKDAIAVGGDQVIVAHLVLDLLGNVEDVAWPHDVTGPVSGVDDDVKRAGVGEVAGPDLLEEFAEGKGLYLDLTARLLTPLLPHVLHRAGDLRAGLGRDDQLHA